MSVKESSQTLPVALGVTTLRPEVSNVATPSSQGGLENGVIFLSFHAWS